MSKLHTLDLSVCLPKCEHVYLNQERVDKLKKDTSKIEKQDLIEWM